MGLFDGVSFYISDKTVKNARAVRLVRFSLMATCLSHTHTHTPVEGCSGEGRRAERVLPQPAGESRDQ